MEYFYEIITREKDLPVKIFIQNMDKIKMHFHSELEIILILKGSINIRIENKKYKLKENDIMAVNPNEIHSTSRTDENNILLALQIDPSYYSKYYKHFNKIRFCCRSFEYSKDEQYRFDIIRKHLSQILLENYKKNQGYKLIIGSEVNRLLSFLLNNFKCSYIDEDEVTNIKKDMRRIESIISYIDENYNKKITLKEIADNEYLSVYHMSHFIKDILGISFQEYLNIKRLDKFIELLMNTNKTITEMSYESGFPSPKSLNRLFKIKYNCSPSEYKKNNIDKDKYLLDKKTTEIDKKEAYKEFFIYIEDLNRSIEKTSKNIDKKDRKILDREKSWANYEKDWARPITFTRASEGLTKAWQEEIKEIQKEVKFEYIKFYSIFSDDILTIDVDSKNNIIYNWTYVNKLFDFLKENNIKPFIELGFMTAELKDANNRVFFSRTNISKIKNMKQWIGLVRAFIENCINRYGIEEVVNWYFEVWNPHNIEYVFWKDGQDRYFEFYKETTLAIKSICENIKVGAPAMSI